MKKTNYLVTLILLAFFTITNVHAQGNFSLTENFGSSAAKYEKIGRGEAAIANSLLTTRDAYLGFGENSWANYEIKFRARVPQTADQVQICSGFRAGNRDDRYIVMLKGGIQKDLYLARLGYMGTDDFLALRQLDFQPVPGKWYDFKIQVAGNRIRIYLNDENLPRIDVIDKLTDLAPKGKVTLGGSWITNEFANLSIRSISADELSGRVQEYAVAGKNKEAERKIQRKAYQPINIKNINSGRTIISLNGKWLFSPGYETTDDSLAINPVESDKDWHIMTVPNFWNPIHVWLHGEKYNSASKGVSDNYFQKEADRCSAYTFDYKKTNVGWYRQWINLPDAIKGKNLQLSFDAVSKVAEVYINGVKAGSHIGMFGNFEVNATGLFKPGKNLVTVKVVRDYVKNIKDADKLAGVAVTVEVTQKMVQDLAHGFFGDDPAGIWQPVSLVITNPVRIEDVFIQPTLAGADFNITVKNDADKTSVFSVGTGITGFKENDLLYKALSLKGLEIQPGEQKTFTYHIAGLQPRLWSPDHPNLYDFEFTLLTGNNTAVDSKMIRSGFRTFKSVGDYLYLNGKRYWLRGGNQTALPLAPNDTALADKFTKLMKAGNIVVTRTHTVPATETWMDAFDANGIGVSYEGTWPWLFLQSSMPQANLVNLWKEEFYDLLKKYRNHPSLLFWTVNNEMKFYDNDPDAARADVKMHIISDVVKHMRVVDPTRPIVFDSNYKRNVKKFGADYFNTIDDGDIDDPHAYLNWYDYSIFDYFKGEWQQKNKNEGRPLISQEMSTGYTDETGHATRFYNYVHQNPESLAGKFTYEYCDPKYFMIPQAFITKELAEALRRSDDRSAGILHFALITWFSNVYLANGIKPFPVYYDMQKALQPVLVSAELWGRHFYSGTQLPVRICVIDDKEDGTALPASKLQWQLVGNDGYALAGGEVPVPQVEHYTRQWLEPHINIPAGLPKDKIAGKLLLKLVAGGKTVSENYYDVLLANKAGLNTAKLAGKKIALYDAGKQISPSLDFLGIKYVPSSTLAELLKQKADVYVLSGLDSVSTTAEDIKSIRNLIAGGGKVLLPSSGDVARILYPEYIRSVMKVNGEITTMDIPESDIFNGIEPLETRYLNNNKRESPAAISGAYRINRNPNIEALASFTKIHGYLPGQVKDRVKRLDEIKGFSIVKIKDHDGEVLLSEMMLDKTVTDPVAGKLLVNMLVDLSK
ncbi:MAG: glycosyl hydrolase family 2 [Mucilaginibacter sp.]|nr:glycosyl hydrolase family 2 [Mucilaginibacter sp.]